MLLASLLLGLFLTNNSMASGHQHDLCSTTAFVRCGTTDLRLCGAVLSTNWWLTTSGDCLYDELIGLTFFVDKGSARGPLFPQLYRVRKLLQPLWGTTGRRVSRQPGSQET
jgi:hypothetical protein